MRLISAALTILFLSITAFAESRISTEEADRHPWHVRAGVEIPGYDFDIEDKGKAAKLSFAPSIRANWVIGISHAKYLTLSAGIGIAPKESEQIKKGSSNSTDLRASIVKRAWVLRANFSEFKGFYIENSAAADPAWNSSGPYIRQPELFTRSFGMNLTVALKPQNFSLKALHSQEERQTSSGGSWLAGGQVRREVIAGSTAIIPGAVQSQYGADAAFTNAQFSSLILKGGYGQQFNFSESLLLAGQAMVGLGWVSAQVSGPAIGYRQTRPATKLDVDVALIYNGKENFSGLKLAMDNSNYDTKSLAFSTNLYAINLFYGVRF